MELYDKPDRTQKNVSEGPSFCGESACIVLVLTIIFHRQEGTMLAPMCSSQSMRLTQPETATGADSLPRVMLQRQTRVPLLLR